MTAAVALTAISASAGLPSVNLTDVNGNTVDTATLSNDGKPFIISFFATWCKPCMRELKAIHEVYPDWQDETGVRLIAVSIDEGQNTQKVKPLIEGKGWSDYEVLLDPSNEFKRLRFRSRPQSKQQQHRHPSYILLSFTLLIPTIKCELFT